MKKRNTHKNWKIRALDIGLGILTAAAISLTAGWFLARDTSAAARFALPGDPSQVTPQLLRSALTGEERLLTAQEINGLLQSFLPWRADEKTTVEGLYLQPCGEAGSVEFCIQLLRDGRLWVLSGTGELTAQQEENIITGFIFQPKRLALGKLPLPTGLLAQLAEHIEGAQKLMQIRDEAIVFSADFIPVRLVKFEVTQDAFAIQTQDALSQLWDQLKNQTSVTAGATPEEALKEWEEALSAQGIDPAELGSFLETVLSQITEEGADALEQGTKDFAAQAKQYWQEYGDEISKAAQQLLGDQ